MKRVNILDCTLRDGAYLIDSQFGNTAIKGIIEGLTESGIDVIECGFLKDEPHREGTTIFNNAAQLRSFLPTDKRHSSYVCLADYSRITALQLMVYVPAFLKANVLKLLIFVKQSSIKDTNFMCSLLTY